MSSVTLEDAQARLGELIHHLRPGEELIITREEQPVARLISVRPPRKQRHPGNCKGMLTIAHDDDDHLQNFAEYMP